MDVWVISFSFSIPTSLFASHAAGDFVGDFEILSEIGRGTYGTVFKVRSRRDQRVYVAKQIVLRNMKPLRRQKALAEVCSISLRFPLPPLMCPLIGSASS